MRDAINIKDREFHIDGIKTHATNVWITEYNEIYISLKHPRGGTLNVSSRDINKYCEPMYGHMMYDNPENLSENQIQIKICSLGNGENRNVRVKTLMGYSTERIPKEEWKAKYTR
jgi:hypothetical protein